MCHRLDSVHVRRARKLVPAARGAAGPCRHTPVRGARWHATRVLLLVNRLYRAPCVRVAVREREALDNIRGEPRASRVHRRATRQYGKIGFFLSAIVSLCACSAIFRAFVGPGYLDNVQKVFVNVYTILDNV